MKKRILSGIIAAVLALSVGQGLVFAEPIEGGENYAADLDAHYAEMEAERERMEAERAEMEAERERMESERAEHERRMAELFGEPLRERPERPPVPDELSAAADGLGTAASRYSEIVYIKNAEQLLAIDGHDGGYYELTADIDISGMEWKPLTLTNATFNGKGHSISGMTIHNEPAVKEEKRGEYTYKYSCAGFLDYGCSNAYVMGLVLSDIDIRFTKDPDVDLYVSASGSWASFFDNCTVTGKIDVTVNAGRAELYGLYNAEGCIAELDMDLTDNTDDETADSYIYGISNCTDCELLGNVTGSGDWIDGIGGSTDCTLYGDVTCRGRWACGISSNCTDCTLYGDVTCSGNYSCGIYYGCTGCAIYGDVKTGSDYRALGIFAGCTDCAIYGNVTGDGIRDNCTGCAICGDVTGDGIWDNCTGCAIYGNVTGRGIYRGCTGCAIYGNVTGYRIYGIYLGCTGCYISGTITEKKTGQPDLTVTAKQPYMAYYKCSHCGAEMTTRNYYNSSPIHCWSWSGKTPYANYYWMENNLRYSDTVTLTPVDPEDPEPGENPNPEPEDEPGGEPSATSEPVPTPKPVSYTVQVLDDKGNAPLSGAEVSIGGQKFTTDENGVIVVKDGDRVAGAMKVKYGGSVIYTNASFRPVLNAMNTVRVKPIYLEPEDINIGKSGAASISGPTINVLGKSSTVLDMPCSWDFNILDTVKVAYDPKEKSYKYILGTKSDIGAIQGDDLTPEFIKKYQEIQEVFSGKKSLAKTNNGNNYAGKNNKGKTSMEVFLELKLDEKKGMYMTNGGIVVGFSYGVEGSFTPFAAFPLAFVAYGITGEAGAQLLFHLDDPKLIDPQFKSEGEVSFALKPTVGVGAGFRGALSGEVGIKGNIGCTFSFPFESMPKNFKAKLDASLYIMANAWIFEFNGAWPFVDYQLYPRLGAASEDIFTIAGEEDFTPVSRDYLYDMSVMAESPDTIKANLYPYSEVQTVQLSDGRTLMVWLDDDTERADMDRTALYYSILDNGTWSEPQQIENDGTADFSFALSSNGSKAAVVWQDMNGNMAEDASMSDMAQGTELSYAEFDGSAWGAPIAVTGGNSAFEYAPRLYYDGNTGYIAWTENDENSAMPTETAAERVYSVTVRGANVSEPQCRIENIPLIYETEIGANGAVACIADKDGDKETKDGILYVNDLKCHESGMLMSGLRWSDSGFCFTDGGTLRRSGGSSTYASAVYDGSADGARLITSGSERAVVYEVQDGFTSNLYASYYKNNAWTNPVRITDYSEKLRSWDAELADDGTINVFAVLADISVEDSDVKQSVRLAHTIAEPIESVEVRYIEAEPQRGKTVDFAIGVDNETQSDTLNISVAGESAGELYTGTATAENGVITVSVPIPEDFTKQKVTVTVSGESGAAGSITEVMGYADLEVMLTQNGKYARVTNKGCDTAENVTLTVEDENGAELAKTTVETLAPGENIHVNITMPENYTGYVTASAAAETGEAADYNNSARIRVSENSIGRLKVNANTAVIEPGESYMPTSNASALYGISDNEAVASVDDTGKITAVSDGTATITYTAPGAGNAAKVRVYVHKLGTPEITSAEYESGEVRLAVNTSSCLAEDETEQLIAAAYAVDGTLIGIAMQDATAAEDVSVYINTGGREPARVKVMLWNTAQKPAAYAAETAAAE